MQGVSGIFPERLFLFAFFDNFQHSGNAGIVFFIKPGMLFL